MVNDFVVRYLVFSIFISLIILSGCHSQSGGHEHGSHYAGQEKREIKALSDEDIKNLQEGNGMGFAKVAELNGFPGPKHILENEAELNLSKEQKQAVEKSFNEMKTQAKELGGKVIEKEKQFDVLFQQNKIENAEMLRSKTEEIAKLKGDLRSVHLAAHLEMKKVLSSEQIEQYKKLRGYSN